ncbi:YbaB/EbfC family nucleoid-associated protein [Lentilactobacillus sp. Marseille-Q4993]|uniref:YbaB/EbfC family nucleoid-associated protein n=1 Tax=Lentilactobacillus sp. Marseille-Q4993 TaxID=3039492 RepID=UPI0024BCAF4E|nr:YbaB/EbfC family nucleoid-associated protein [Lentilactobacillus sp. Marseille-Q4993]
MMNGMNMNKMMKQMKKMQKQMAEEQENLKEQEFVGTDPSEMVTAKFYGEKKMTDLSIKPEAIDPDDPDMLADLILTAVNDGITKVEKATQDTMGKYTKGLPGL